MTIMATERENDESLQAVKDALNHFDDWATGGSITINRQTVFIVARHLEPERRRAIAAAITELVAAGEQVHRLVYLP